MGVTGSHICSTQLRLPQLKRESTYSFSLSSVNTRSCRPQAFLLNSRRRKARKEKAWCSQRSIDEEIKLNCYQCKYKHTDKLADRTGEEQQQQVEE